MAAHWAAHTDVKPFKCPRCERDFNAPALLERHKLTHDLQGPGAPPAQAWRSPVALDTWVVWGRPHSSPQVHHTISELKFLLGVAALLPAPPSSAQEGTVLDDNLGFAFQRPKFKAGGSLMVIQVDCPGTVLLVRQPLLCR